MRIELVLFRFLQPSFGDALDIELFHGAAERQGKAGRCQSKDESIPDCLGIRHPESMQYPRVGCQLLKTCRTNSDDSGRRYGVRMLRDCGNKPVKEEVLPDGDRKSTA